MDIGFGALWDVNDPKLYYVNGSVVSRRRRRRCRRWKRRRIRQSTEGGIRRNNSASISSVENLLTSKILS